MTHFGLSEAMAQFQIPPLPVWELHIPLISVLPDLEHRWRKMEELDLSLGEAVRVTFSTYLHSMELQIAGAWTRVQVRNTVELLKA